MQVQFIINSLYGRKNIYVLCVSHIDHQIEMTPFAKNPLLWRIMQGKAEFNKPVNMDFSLSKRSFEVFRVF